MVEKAQNQFPILSGGEANRHGESFDSVTGQVLCGDLDIRIDRDGQWFYHGTPIGRKALVKLFASVLRRGDDGRYWLETPAEKGEIIVEDAAFMAVALTVHGSGAAQRLEFRTNTDETVIADGDHPLRIALDSDTQEPSPYVLVRDEAALKDWIARAVGAGYVAVDTETTSLDSLTADITLRPWRQEGVRVEGRVRGSLSQACVVTLEPVATTVDEEISLRLHPDAVESGPIEVDVDATDPPELLEEDVIDVGAIVLEHFVLGIEPYPRVAGVEFEVPQEEDDEKEPSPFAVLASLKNG